MRLLDVLSFPDQPEMMGHRIYGVVVGVVTNNQDPDNLNRVKITFPWLNASDEGHWARLATPMAGAQRGFYFLPEVEDEVLVIFEQGDVRFPYIIGALWNGQDAPPIQNDDGNNNIRLIKSRSGHLIRLDDTDGAEKIEIIDKSEKNSLVFDTAANTITIMADQEITLAAAQGKITLDAKEVEINGSQSVTVSGMQVDMEAMAAMNVKGQPINLN